MTDEEVNEFNSAVRMSDWAAANTAVLSNNAKASSGIAALDTDIAALEAAGAVRVSAAGLRTDGTADRSAAKAALYAYVRKIAKTAKRIKLEEPNFDNRFKLERRTLNSQELLDAARAFADDFSPVAAKFEQFGIANAPVEKLNASINAFEAARARQNTGKGGGVAATAQTKATVKNLMKTRRTVKVIVTNILEDTADAGKLAEWKSACRVEKAPKKDKGGTPPTA